MIIFFSIRFIRWMSERKQKFVSNKILFMVQAKAFHFVSIRLIIISSANIINSPGLHHNSSKVWFQPPNWVAPNTIRMNFNGKTIANVWIDWINIEKKKKKYGWGWMEIKVRGSIIPKKKEPRFMAIPFITLHQYNKRYDWYRRDARTNSSKYFLILTQIVNLKYQCGNSNFREVGLKTFPI